MTLTRNHIRSLLAQSLDDIPITILDHTDTTLIGMTGIIVSETRKMLTIRLDDRAIMVSKQYGKFELTIGADSLIIDGWLLKGKSKRRSKRKHRHW